VAKFNTLIVEDNIFLQTIITKILQGILKKENYQASDIEIFYAENSKKAKEIFTAHVPGTPNALDMIILNGNLEDKVSGVELFINLCKLYSNSAIEAITAGWSAEFSDLNSWRKNINKKYSEMSMADKPTEIPKMHFVLKKPTNTDEIETLIKTLIAKQEHLKVQLRGGEEPVGRSVTPTI